MLVNKVDYERRKWELETLLAISSRVEEFFQIIRKTNDISKIAVQFELSPEQVKYLLNKRMHYLTSLRETVLAAEYKKINDALQKGVPEIRIQNHCLREQLIQHYGESIQTAQGLAQITSLYIMSKEVNVGTELKVDDCHQMFILFDGASTKYLFEDLAKMPNLQQLYISGLDFSNTKHCIADLSHNSKLEKIRISLTTGIHKVIFSGNHLMAVFD